LPIFFARKLDDVLPLGRIEVNRVTSGSFDRDWNGNVKQATRIIPILIIALVIMAPVCVLSGGDSAERQVSVTLDDGALVEVIGQNAEVRLVPSESNELTLTAKLNNAEYVDFYTQSLTPSPVAHFVISATTGTGGQTTANSVLEIAIPDGTQVAVRTTNRSIHVQGVTASSFELETEDGNVNVENVIGDVQVTTSNSAVSVRDVAGSTTIMTTNGHVWFRDELSSGRNSITTENGDIFVELLPGSDVHVTGETHNGSVTINDSTDGVDEDGDQAEFVHVIGDGTARLSITNGPGAIHINPSTIAAFDTSQ